MDAPVWRGLADLIDSASKGQEFERSINAPFMTLLFAQTSVAVNTDNTFKP